MNIFAAIIVASDTRSLGKNEDKSGPALKDALEAAGVVVKKIEVVPDEKEIIAKKIAHYCDAAAINLVITSGGTGLTPRDVTPEATLSVVEKQVSGIVEMLRAKSLKITPFAALSRAVAGIRNKTLVINLPGSPKAAKESVQFLAPILPHAIETVTGKSGQCGS